MKKSELEIIKNKPTKSSKVRDFWITETWRYNGAGFQKNKKAYSRKAKHKQDYSQE